jgi:hypothetical protein
MKKRCCKMRTTAIMAAFALTMGFHGVAWADITTTQWQEMNTDYQAAYIQGLLAAVTVYGGAEPWQGMIDDGLKCLFSEHRKGWTVYHIVPAFGSFLKKHPDLNNYSVPTAFLEYTLSFCKQP